VEDFKQGHGYSLTWLVGYLNAQYDDIKASKLTRSVTEAKSLQSLMASQGNGAGDGADHYNLSRKWAKAQAKAGKLAGVGLMGAATPAPFGDPYASN